jgi:hypothetical protein
MNNDQTATQAPTETVRKKQSRILFKYTGKPFTVVSKTNPISDTPDCQVLHAAPAAWLTVLKNADKALSRDECVAALAVVAETGTTGTSQPPIRILYYWKKFLTDRGYLATERKA